MAGTGNGDLTDTNINYVGRWDKGNSATYRSYWNGSYLSTKFTGTTVKVKLAEKTVFMAIIDGVPTTHWDRIGTVDLTPTPLANGTHTLKIISKYEKTELPFQGLVLDAGASTVRPDPLPVVEFIGDSITSGVTTTDVAVSDYAWLTGERMGADHTQISYPGITLSDGYHYSDNTFPGMESLYFKLWQANRCPDVACTGNPAWNFANYAVKLVVVNLGTNDAFNSVPSATFQSRYTTFLQNIRAKFPNADIFALRTFGGYYQTETQAVVNARISAGDAKVHYVDTTGWLDSSTGSTDFTDGVHPGDAGHVKVSNRLLPILLPYLGNVTRNDTQFSYDTTANWPSGGQNGAYLNDNHWSSVPNAYYQVPFTGTQVKLYGGQAPAHGIAAVSIDGGAETLVDAYSATRKDDVLLWSSPVLSAGSHTLKVRTTGAKNASATGTYVVGDRVDVIDGGVNLLSNAGFEGGLSGWSTWSQGGTVSSATTQPNSGSSHLVHNGTGAYQAYTAQTLTGLPNGSYTVKAWVRGTAGHQLYVKGFGGSQVSVTSVASNVYTQLTISNINVSNGSAEIGFWTSVGSGTGWLHVDDMTFYKQ
ncbi:lysophospholipase L1-like esterase [Pelomonas aquatica]|uniref:Lysophospholipase L1-like esterase n=1 Tax=Pelomonas aquatica TaxID=431058 RepID=A0ABU1Z571_9BURK|nr:GDSL-type esterase/lipase family protein [Pelomonas aquatica]MDR7295759.1 lysophospholipase L1-like esterase [Pelomonas aquatica]